MRKRLAGIGATLVLLAGFGTAAAPAATASVRSVGPFATHVRCLAEQTLFRKEGYTNLGPCNRWVDGWRFTVTT